ncbi:MAG: hypothetical protein GY703_17820 [Gammaproteobacteria bacterium]|nr:hypothetical protein [Gammaproteobacteria bacterium]
MSTASSPLTGLTILGAVLYTQVQAESISCHLHAPDDYTPFSNSPLSYPRWAMNRNASNSTDNASAQREDAIAFKTQSALTELAL